MQSSTTPTKHMRASIRSKIKGAILSPTIKAKINMDQWREMQRAEYIQILKWKFRPPDQVLPRQSEHIAYLARVRDAKIAEVRSEECSQETIILKASKRLWNAPSAVSSSSPSIESCTAQNPAATQSPVVGFPHEDVQERVQVLPTKRSWHAPPCVVCDIPDVDGDAGNRGSSPVKVGDVEEVMIPPKRARSWQAPSVVDSKPPDHLTEIVQTGSGQPCEETEAQEQFVMVPLKRTFHAPPLVTLPETSRVQTGEISESARADHHQAETCEEEITLNHRSTTSRKRWHGPLVVVKGEDHHEQSTDKSDCEREAENLSIEQQTNMEGAAQEESLAVPSKRRRHTLPLGQEAAEAIPSATSQQPMVHEEVSTALTQHQTRIRADTEVLQALERSKQQVYTISLTARTREGEHIGLKHLTMLQLFYNRQRGTMQLPFSPIQQQVFSMAPPLVVLSETSSVQTGEISEFAQADHHQAEECEEEISLTHRSTTSRKRWHGPLLVVKEQNHHGNNTERNDCERAIENWSTEQQTNMEGTAQEESLALPPKRPCHIPPLGQVAKSLGVLLEEHEEEADEAIVGAMSQQAMVHEKVITVSSKRKWQAPSLDLLDDERFYRISLSLSISPTWDAQMHQFQREVGTGWGVGGQHQHQLGGVVEGGCLYHCSGIVFGVVGRGQGLAGRSSSALGGGNLLTQNQTKIRAKTERPRVHYLALERSKQQVYTISLTARTREGEHIGLKHLTMLQLFYNRQRGTMQLPRHLSPIQQQVFSVAQKMFAETQRSSSMHYLPPPPTHTLPPQQTHFLTQQQQQASILKAGGKQGQRKGEVGGREEGLARVESCWVEGPPRLFGIGGGEVHVEEDTTTSNNL